MARLVVAAAAATVALLLWPVLASAGTPITPVSGHPPTVSTQAPVIDNPITATYTGSWTGSPTIFSYQWYDCDADPSDPNDCVPITGATSATYMVTPDDGGDLLAVGVTASDTSGDTGSAMSAPTTAVAARPNAPAIVPGDDPTVSGGGAVGSAATGTTGTWTGSPTKYTEQWYSCAPDGSNCQAITGANGLSYTPVPGNVGQVLVLEVWATNSAGDSIPDNSDPSPVIGGANPTITVTAPAQGSTFAEGAQVTAQFSCSTFDGSAPIECDATDDIGNSIVPGGAIDTGVPGSHTLTITAIDQYGSVASTTIAYTVTAGGTQQPSGPSSGTPAGTLSLTDLRQSAKVWRLRAARATPAGTSFSFVASAPARVTYTFSRLVAGRRVAGACVAGTRAERSRPRCTHSVLDGSISIDATAGPNRHRYDGRLAGGGRLVPGRYVVTVRARPIGASSGAGAVTAGTLHFTVVK